MRVFRVHDPQRRGTLTIGDFVAMLAPCLEHALSQKLSSHALPASAQGGREDAMTLGAAYMQLAAEANARSAEEEARAVAAKAKNARTRRLDSAAQKRKKRGKKLPTPTGGHASRGSSSDHSARGAYPYTPGSGQLPEGLRALPPWNGLASAGYSMARESAAFCCGSLGAASEFLQKGAGLIDLCGARLQEAVGDRQRLTQGRASGHASGLSPSQDGPEAGHLRPTTVRPTIPTAGRPNAESPTQQTFDAHDAATMATQAGCGVAAVDASRALFALADTTGSGALDFNEFVALLTSGAISRVADTGEIDSKPPLQAQTQANAPGRAVGKSPSRSSGLSSALFQGLAVGADARWHRSRMLDRAMERADAASIDMLSYSDSAAADEAIQMFAKADADGSGVLTLPHFVRAVEDASGRSTFNGHVHSEGRKVGEMEARLWFAALDKERRGYIDVTQWLSMLLERTRADSSDGAWGGSGMAATVLRGVASDAAHIDAAQRRPGAASTNQAKVGIWNATRAIELLDPPRTDASLAQLVPDRFKATVGQTAAAEAAADAAAAAAEAARAAESAARAAAEDVRLHAYLSKLVSQADSVLTTEGTTVLAALPSHHLSAALALFERYDGDADGRLQRDEFSDLLVTLAKQHGTRFSEGEAERLFRAADLAGAGSIDLLELLLLLQQLALTPIAPADAEAYRSKLMRTAARSVVQLESVAAASRCADDRNDRKPSRKKRMQLAGSSSASGGEQEDIADSALQSVAAAHQAHGSVLVAPPDAVDEVALLLGRFDQGRKGYDAGPQPRTNLYGPVWPLVPCHPAQC